MLGLSLRQFAQKADWMDVIRGCKPEELYASTSFKERSVSSMTSLLQGLCGQKFEFPVPSPAEAGFTVSLPTQEEDFILRADDDTCARVKSIEDATESAPGTFKLIDGINDFLETNFFPRLRYLTGLKEEDLEEFEMFDVADYISWAVKHDYKLKFSLTDKDLNFIEATD